MRCKGTTFSGNDNAFWLFFLLSVNNPRFSLLIRQKPFIFVLPFKCQLSVLRWRLIALQFEDSQPQLSWKTRYIMTYNSSLLFWVAG